MSVCLHVKSTVEGTPAGFTVRHPYGIRLVQPTTLISYGGGDGDHLFMGAVPGRVVIGSTVYSGVYAYKAMDDVGTNTLELDSGIEPSYFLDIAPHDHMIFKKYGHLLSRANSRGRVSVSGLRHAAHA